MDLQPPNYRAEFLRSPHHAVFGLLTLGLGFLTADPLGLIAGVTAYGLGWIYLPDLAFFRAWVEKRHAATRQVSEEEKVQEFSRRREALLGSLGAEARQRYQRLAQVCRDIESASADSAFGLPQAGGDPRLRKLDELMWTFLRLLGIEQSLQKFIETEQNEDIPALLKEAEAEADRLKKELDQLQAAGNSAPLDTKRRYFNSRLERLEVLRKRQQRCEQAQANLQLVASEQDRLEQQIKLLRADAVASKNADTLTARIDATVEHLDQTNKWLSELDEFKDLTGDLPETELRVGYQADPVARVAPPPIISGTPVRGRQPARQSGH